MCRGKDHGGRRCPVTARVKNANREAANRYYARGKARLRIAELSNFGVPAIGDEQIPDSFHIGTVDRETLDVSAGNADDGVDKPSGAFWTAPGRESDDGTVKTAWTDFHAEQGQPSFVDAVSVSPNPGSVVISITTPEQEKAVLDCYGIDTERGRRLDWEAMTKDGVDGFYVDTKMANRGPGTAFYGWDIASIAWLQKDAVAIGDKVDLGKYEYEADEHSFYPELVYKDGHGTYNEPEAPDMDKAWDKVPARFKKKGDGKPGGVQRPRGVEQPTISPEAVAAKAREEEALRFLRSKLIGDDIAPMPNPQTVTPPTSPLPKPGPPAVISEVRYAAPQPKSDLESLQARLAAMEGSRDLVSAGITVLHDTDVPSSFHYKSQDFSELALNPVSNQLNQEGPGVFLAKPQGAFWSSPGTAQDDGSVSTPWASHNIHIDDDGAYNEGLLHEVRVKPNAVIADASNEEQVNALARRYFTKPGLVGLTWDWDAMKSDGIHGIRVSGEVSKSFIRSNNMAMQSFSGWDIDSVAWFDTSVLEVGTAHRTHRDL